MRQSSECSLCGFEKVGKHCICEYMTSSERIVWKETGQIPKHLSGYTLEDLEAEEEEVKWWYMVHSRQGGGISFPEAEVCCRYCPLMRSDAGNTRHVCISTGEILGNIDIRPKTCPIEELKEDEHGS